MPSSPTFKRCLPMFLVFLSLLPGCSDPETHTVYCVDMMQACGEDCPEYQVYTIDGDSSNLESIELDAHMNQKLDSVFNAEIGFCTICYTVNFTGELSYNSWRNCYEMEVSSYELFLRPACCEQ